MHPYLMPALELAPKTFERIVAQIPEKRYDEHTDPNRFTLREAIAHLADWEPIFLQRIQAGVDNPGSEVKGMDEGVRARDQKYESWDVKESLRIFTEARAVTIRYLQALSKEQWETTVFHNEKGSMTAYDQATMLNGHDIYHLEHASQFMGHKVAGTW
jgi:uncharacterized damage-inducible protein DinB